MVGPKGIEGYVAMSGGIFLILAKRHVVLFSLSAALVGFAITLWPVIAWVVPWP